MNEFIEKLISRLEENLGNANFEKATKEVNESFYEGMAFAYGDSINIVNHLAEEYKTSFMQELVEARRNCSEDSDCSQCIFGQIEDRCILAELQIDADLKRNNGWIPCSERLPDKDMWCLATFESGGIDKIPYLVTNNWGWNGEFADNKVVAWMPLPEPYIQ